MKNIETFYNGYHFRSRLEARWAVFFDNAGIKYEYEPEGFEHEGKRYLPDFYLPEVYLASIFDFGNEIKGFYVEIKNDQFEMPLNYLSWFDKPLILFKGMPEKYQPINCGYESQFIPVFSNIPDDMLMFAHFKDCPKCNKTYYTHISHCNMHDRKLSNESYYEDAAQKAKQARFEFL